MIDDATSAVTPSSWLAGARAAVVLTINVAAEAELLVRAPEQATNLMWLSHQSFAPLIGVPRILGLLDELGAPATFFVGGRTAERYPATVEAILEAGQEVGHTSYAGGAPINLGAEEEAEDFERGLAVLRALGADVRGHRSPAVQSSVRTPELVARSGLDYDSSLMDDDRPYLLRMADGTLVELPPSWALDDWMQYVYLPLPETFRLKPVDEVLAGWQLELEAMREEGGLLTLTLDAGAHGRSSRLEGLRRLIAGARDTGDVALLAGREVAAAARRDPSLPVRALEELTLEPEPSLYPVV